MNSAISDQQISLSGSGGGVTLSLNVEASYLNGIANGDVFFIADNNTGGAFINSTSTVSYNAFGGQTFAVLNVPVGAQNLQFAISYDASIANNQFSMAGGNDIALMAVPEPSTVATMLAGLASLAGLQRFRRRSSKK
jgi:hypothetical protein